MSYDDIVLGGFQDELEKISGSMQGHIRTSRRPMSVETLLRREKSSTMRPSDLFKSANISLSGLSDQTIAAGQEPPATLETPGMRRALDILNRAQIMNVKTAEEEKKPNRTPTAIDTAKDVFKHVAAGAGGGKLVGDLVGGIGEHHPRVGLPTLTPKQKFNLTLIGSLLGGLEYGRKRLMKNANVVTPYHQLLGSYMKAKKPSLGNPSVAAQSSRMLSRYK